MKYAYCLLDTETTGLHRLNDQVYDIAWKFLDAQTLLEIGPKPQPFNISGVHKRWCGMDVPLNRISEYTWKSTNFALYMAAGGYKHDLLNVHVGQITAQSAALIESGYDDVFLVGANPAFDDSFIRLYNDDKTPYKYRMIDLENQAMRPMRLQVPPGFHEVIKHYLGPGIVQPHSAEGDVLLLERVLLEMRDRGDM